MPTQEFDPNNTVASIDMYSLIVDTDVWFQRFQGGTALSESGSASVGPIERM